jgi:hypothetical protein
MRIPRSFESRKFLIAVAVLTSIEVMVFTHLKIDPDLASLIKWIVGLYYGGNVGQKLVQWIVTPSSKAPAEEAQQ